MKMIKLFLLILLVFGITSTAQTLLSGSYSSSDLGNTYTVLAKHEGNTVTITEPNRSNQYRSNGGIIYNHTEQKYSNFYIKVVSENKYLAGKQGAKEQMFTYNGNNTNYVEVLPLGIDDCPLYDKYLQLAQTNEIEVQAWAFCGAAALAKCTYSDSTNYLEPLIKALKSIAVDLYICPCQDVITQAEWNAVKTE
jgi:hypothetical protein